MTQQTKSHLSIRAAVEAGFIAGLVFLFLEYFTAYLGAASPLGPASITLREALNLQAPQTVGGFVVAVLIMHFALSLVTTLVLGYFIHRWVLYWAITLGVVYGAFLYTINFMLFALVLPGITPASDIFMVVDYMIYGGIAAWGYKWREAALGA